MDRRRTAELSGPGRVAAAVGAPKGLRPSTRALLDAVVLLDAVGCHVNGGWSGPLGSGGAEPSGASLHGR